MNHGSLFSGIGGFDLAAQWMQWENAFHCEWNPFGQKKPGRITKKSVPNNWENFPTQPPVRYGNDGLSSRLDGITFPKWRNESIKGGGNAIVPQVAHQIFKAIQEYEDIKR